MACHTTALAASYSVEYVGFEESRGRRISLHCPHAKGNTQLTPGRDVTGNSFCWYADASHEGFGSSQGNISRSRLEGNAPLGHRRVHTEGFDGDTDSVIALLVFALGELAIEGSRGTPIGVHNGRPSGLRGGSLRRPPGLALFNEARKRIGFVLTECDLENVQIFSLAACVVLFCCISTL